MSPSLGIPPRRFEVTPETSQPPMIRYFHAEQGYEQLLLKEYVGVGTLGADAASALEGWSDELSGENEIAIYEYILAQVQDDPDKGSVPQQLPRLLGYMQTGRSAGSSGFGKKWETQMHESVLPPRPGSLWLIFKWEPWHRLSLFAASAMRATLATSPGSAPWERAAEARLAFVKTAARQSLGTLAWLHSHGVVHRSISQSSLRLSTLEPNKWHKLNVQLHELGFATTASHLTREDLLRTIRRGKLTSPLEVLPMLCLEDLRALGYVLLELIFHPPPYPPIPSPTS